MERNQSTMMHRSRERCNLYTRVYLGTRTHVAEMHTASYVSLSTWKRSTWAQRIIGSHSALELPTASVRPPTGFLPPKFASSRVRPVPYINSAQFETYRRCLPLCVFADSSRVKPVFIAYPYASEPFTARDTARRAAAGGGGTCSRREITWVRLSESQERRNPAAPCFHGDTIHLLAPPMCDMTYIASYTLLLETNLPSEDPRSYRQYR